MNKNHLLLPSNRNSYLAIKAIIAQKILRQACYSFNLSIITAIISFCINLIGAGLLLSNKVSEGTATAAGGMVTNMLCVQLAKDANDRLEKILAELKDED